jgi:hypothetical protein
MVGLCILWNHQHVVMSYEDQEITRTPASNTRHWIPEKRTEHCIYEIAGKSPQQQSSSSQIAFQELHSEFQHFRKLKVKLKQS